MLKEKVAVRAWWPPLLDEVPFILYWAYEKVTDQSQTQPSCDICFSIFIKWISFINILLRNELYLDMFFQTELYLKTEVQVNIVLVLEVEAQWSSVIVIQDDLIIVYRQ